MTPQPQFIPALALLCLFSGMGHGQTNNAQMSAAREAANLILNAAGDTRASKTNRISRRNGGQVVRIFSDLDDQEELDYESVAILFGDGVIHGDVKNELFVLWGDVRVNGRVEGHCGSVFGSVILGPDAELLGETRIIGGKLVRDPLSVVMSQPIEMGGNYEEWPLMSATVDWVKHGILFGRPVAPGVVHTWIAAALFFLAYVLAASVFPRPVRVCADSMKARPASTFIMGMLVPILIGLLSALLVMTGIGLFLVPFLLIAFAFATLLGKAAVMQYVGRRLGEAMNKPGLQSPGVALFTGGIILCLLYTIPVVGILVWSVTMLFAMGAAMLAVMESLQAEGSEIVAVPESELSDSTAMVHVGPVRERRPAGFWIRSCAMLLDGFLLTVLTLGVGSIIGPLVIPMIYLYFVGLWTWKQSSLGGIVMNIRVERIRQEKLDFSTALVRSIGSTLSLLAFGLGFVWTAVSRDKRSWHDHLAGTNVYYTHDRR
ncbi:MAG: RDD family protein [Limisphaerales bacterium]